MICFPMRSYLQRKFKSLKKMDNLKLVIFIKIFYPVQLESKIIKGKIISFWSVDCEIFFIITPWDIPNWQSPFAMYARSIVYFIAT